MAFWREPVVHFLAAGLVLFVAFSLFGDDDAGVGQNTIVVDRAALLTFLQYRANAFDAETFNVALDAMTDEELREVIDAYVDEEILVREARSLGLDESDNIIRQRLAQKMNFLLADVTTVDGARDRPALEAYFAENIEAYAVPSSTTFTHVFFDAEERGADGALAAAQQALVALNAAGTDFNEAPQHGDNFPFLRNYVDRTLDYVASHFGNEFAAAIGTLEAKPDEWQGPIRSAFGQHIVLLTARTERRYARLDEVLSEVQQDFAAEVSNAALKDVTREMRQRYSIRLEDIRAASE